MGAAVAFTALAFLTAAMDEKKVNANGMVEQAEKKVERQNAENRC